MFYIKLTHFYHKVRFSLILAEFQRILGLFSLKTLDMMDEKQQLIQRFPSLIYKFNVSYLASV